jgi:lysophospholipase L1-like esterase
MYQFVSCIRPLAVVVVGVAMMAGSVAAKSVEPRGSTLPHVASRIGHDAPLRIVAFGSSSTEGVGASSPAATYPHRLEEFLAATLRGRVQVINAGIGGEDADDMTRRIPSVVAQHPDLIIWQTGSNDPLRNVPLDRFVSLTREGILAMRRAGIDVMLMEQQDCAVLRAHPGSLAYRDALRQLASDMGVPLIRRYDLMHAWLAAKLLTPSEMMFKDGLHMGDGGYALLAADVGREILSLSGLPAPAAVQVSSRISNGR